MGEGGAGKTGQRGGHRPHAVRSEPAHEVDSNRDSAKPANAVTTDFGAELGAQAGVKAEPHPDLSPSASACEVHRETIESGLSRGRNAMAIWQDLVDSCGFAGGYQSVKRFVRKLRGKQSPEACAIIETAPGEESQVDYGTGPMARDPRSGKYRRTRLFVLTLGYSRKSVRLLVFRSSSQTWAELHEQAFRRLGGCTRVVVLDNLREGVLAPDIYDPTGPKRRRMASLSCDKVCLASSSLVKILSTATFSNITASSRCLAASRIRIEKGRSNPASAMRRKHC
jgi:hypothetical protein